MNQFITASPKCIRGACSLEVSKKVRQHVKFVAYHISLYKLFLQKLSKSSILPNFILRNLNPVLGNYNLGCKITQATLVQLAMLSLWNKRTKFEYILQLNMFIYLLSTKSHNIKQVLF